MHCKQLMTLMLVYSLTYILTLFIHWCYFQVVLHYVNFLIFVFQKKGGNVKPIPPYKPISNEAHNSDSNSEKEPETGSSKSHISPPVNKKRSGVTGKTTPSKASNKSNSSQQKTVHNNKNSDKTKVSNSSSSTNSKSDKSAEPQTTSADQKLDKKDQKSVDSSAVETVADKDKEVVKDNKSSKKRKVNSRTPTPVSVSVTASDISVVVTAVTNTSPIPTTVGVDNKRSNTVSEISPDKVKKVTILIYLHILNHFLP